MKPLGGRGQSMVEFALLLPVFVLFIFGILDFGRSIYYYNAVSQAVGEAARAVALAPTSLPANSDALTAAQAQASWITLAPCPNQTVDSSNAASAASDLAGGAAYLFIGNPGGANVNSDGANAPGGESGTSTCTATPALSSNHDRLQVTIVYKFTPFTPLISQFTGSQILLTSTSVVPVEY